MYEWMMRPALLGRPKYAAKQSLNSNVQIDREAIRHATTCWQCNKATVLILFCI